VGSKGDGMRMTAEKTTEVLLYLFHQNPALVKALYLANLEHVCEYGRLICPAPRQPSLDLLSESDVKCLTGRRALYTAESIAEALPDKNQLLEYLRD